MLNGYELFAPFLRIVDNNNKLVQLSPSKGLF